MRDLRRVSRGRRRAGRRIPLRRRVRSAREAQACAPLVDTGALLALSRRRDQHHRRAVEIAERHLVSGGEYVGTTLILGELHSHLLYLRGADEARKVLQSLLDDPVHEWVDVSPDLVRDAVTNWLARFADQRFSLVDAVSFEVMRRNKLSQAFAFDQHFLVAGFDLLQ